jgi:hypothetical protein
MVRRPPNPNAETSNMSAPARDALPMLGPGQPYRHPLGRVARHVREVRAWHRLGTAAAVRVCRTGTTQSREQGSRAYFQHLSLLIAAAERRSGRRDVVGPESSEYLRAINRPMQWPGKDA